MKKILIATLILAIFIAFTVYANASSSRITIRSAEELAEMRRMIEAPIEELAEYVRKSFPTEVFTSRQDIISFLELLDSLPIPHEEGMYFSSLTYYPFSNNQTFDISFRNKTGEIHSFRLFAGGDNGKGIFENSSNGESLVEIYRGQDNERQIIVYSPPSAWGDFPNRHGNYTFPMEIDGFFISGGYVPSRSGTHVTAESVYGGMTVTSIRDITWLDRNQPGDIFGEGFVTTANALEILRFVAGLENDIRSQSAMAAADVNGDGKIDTADALEVLRIVAGLA